MKFNNPNCLNPLVNYSLLKERIAEVTDNALQSEIEEKIGIGSGNFSKIINGHAKLTLDFLIKISEAYHCSIDYLLGRDDLPNRNDDELTAYDLIYAMAVAKDIGAVDIKPYETWDYRPPNYSGVVPQINSVVIRVTNSALNENLRAVLSLMSISSDTEELPKEMLSMWMNRLKEKRISISGSDMVPLKKGD